MHLGGMQLSPAYKHQLDPRFLKWYETEFRSSRMCYLHWPVECIGQDDGHYHIVVGEVDHQVQVWHNTAITQDLDDHTYGRNTNSFAIALGGFSGATTSDLGANCATPEMVDRLVAVIADCLCAQHIPVANVMTHGEAADNVDQGSSPPYPAPWAPDPSPYGPLTTWERWDLHCQIDPTTRRLFAPQGHIPAGTEALADYLRGHVALEIQERTRQHWAS